MLHEIATYGSTMAVVILAAWGIMIGIAEVLERRASAADLAEAHSTDVARGA
jgi:hypothetical protein